MDVKTFTIKNKLGMHARAAASFVKVAHKFKSDIYLERDGQTVSGKSILGILTLACPKGSQLTVKIDGKDSILAMQAIEELIENKFGED